MLTILPENAAPALKALFAPEMPGMLRFQAVLNGDAPGKILTDDASHPAWGVLVENAFGTFYPAGALTKSLCDEIVAALLEQHEEVLYGFWYDDTRYVDLLPAPEYDGKVLEYTQRDKDLSAYLTVPEGCEIRPFDTELLRQSEDYEGDIARYGSAENALEHKIGFALMRGDELLAEASAGAPVGDTVEVGMTTRRAHRGHGHATLLCAHLILACEARGYQTYWNCNAENTPSVKIARKMGYQREREYRLIAWFPKNQ